MRKKTFFAAYILFCVFFIEASFAANSITKEDGAKLGLAKSYMNKGSYGEAVPVLSELYKAYPDDKEIALALAEAFGYSLKPSEAVEVLKELEKRFPDDQKILSTHANILESNKNFRDAREIYQALSKKDPSDQELKSKIADLSSWMGDYETAVNYYQSLLAGRKDPTLEMKLADVFFWSRNYGKAIELYAKMNIDPRGDKAHFKNLGSAYLGDKRYDDAINIYRKLLEIYPDDLETRADIANTLYGAGRVDEAEKEFDLLLKEKPGDVKTMLKIAEILALGQRYDQAIKLCENILKIEPDNNEAKLWLARLLSWNMRYAKSLKVYEEIIKNDPKWVLPRREKARILGWTREYYLAVREYEKALREAGQDNETKLEMRAKDNFYNLYDIGAISAYKKWRDAEPENLEALFDIGQVYSREMQWSNARDAYGKILNILSAHSKADQALRKVDIYSKKILSETGFEWYKAKSAARDVHEEYYNVYTSIKAPIVEGVNFTAREDTIWYLFTNPSSDICERLSVGLEYYMKPYIWASAKYAYNMYSGDVENTHNSSEEINVKPIDPLLVTFLHNREHVVDNGQTYSERIMRNDYKVRTTFDVNRRISAGADYKYSQFSDNNWKNTYGTDVACILIYEPTFLKMTYRYEEYKFAKPSGIYFSPASFHYNTVGIEWRHFLNKEELFWGANDMYYTLKYAVNFDVHNERGHTLYADFHKDWTDRLSTHVEWLKKMYEIKKTYSEDRVTVSLKYSF